MKTLLEDTDVRALVVISEASWPKHLKVAWSILYDELHVVWDGAPVPPILEPVKPKQVDRALHPPRAQESLELARRFLQLAPTC